MKFSHENEDKHVVGSGLDSSVSTDAESLTPSQEEPIRIKEPDPDIRQRGANIIGVVLVITLMLSIIMIEAALVLYLGDVDPKFRVEVLSDTFSILVWLLVGGLLTWLGHNFRPK